MTEKDRLLREMDSMRQELNVSKDIIFDVTDDDAETRQQKEEEIQVRVQGIHPWYNQPLTQNWVFQALKYQLKQAQKMGDMYRDQVIQLEDKLSRIREEGEVGKDLFKVSALKCLGTH